MKNREASSLHGILVIFAAVMPVMAIVSLVPVLPALQKEFASVPGSEYLVPIALTIPAVCLALFSPVAGWLADKLGRKSVLVTALFLYALVGAAPYFLTDLKQIIAARFVLGILEAALMTIATTLVGDYFKGPARERWLAIQVASISVSAVILVFIAGILGGVLGSRGPFLLYLLGIPLALLCLFILFEPEVEKQDEKAEKPRLPFKPLLPLALAAFVFGNLFYITIVKIGDILALVTEISPQLIGQMSAITNGIVILGTVTFGLLKSRMNPPAMVALGSAIIAAGYFTISSSSSVAMSVIGCSLVSVGSGIMLPTFINWVIGLLSIEVRGLGVGLWQGAFFLGQFAAPIVVVAIAKMVGGLAPALAAVSVVALVLCVSMALKTRSYQA